MNIDKVLKVLRVGVANNFNFTKAEIEAVKALRWGLDRLFVNSNSLVTVTADFPSFLTINPYLDNFSVPTGDLSKVKACRIKYVAGSVPVVSEAFRDALQWSLDQSIPVLITFMRFCSKTSLHKYVEPTGTLNYKFSSGYWRLTPEAKQSAVSWLNVLKESMGYADADLNYCDLAGEGCPTCGNCAKLALDCEGSSYELYGINLAESGDAGKCLFHCPDCWAKRLAGFRAPTYGKITQNAKQRGVPLKAKKA